MRDWIKAALQALPIAIGLPVVLFLASVKPEDAASNLAVWAHFLGFSQVPAWLANPAADRHAMVSAIVLSVIYAGAVWGIPLYHYFWAKPEPSKTTPASNKEIEKLVTGGDAFCYFALYYFDVGKNIARNIVIVKEGKYPLYDVRMRVTDLDTHKDVANIQLGEVNGPALVLSGVWSLKDTINYRVFFSARNGMWHQDLLLRKLTKKNYWPAATRVLGRDGRTVRFENVDPMFVSEFGPPKWGQ